MIVVRAPLRISFVGGGTDLPSFYRMETGRVLSVAIDQYVYTVLHHTPLTREVIARYSQTEIVDHARFLKNDRIREALLDLGITNTIEIGIFSHLPGQMGLGGSSSFSVALLKALHTFQGKKMDRGAIAEAAARLEIDLLHEPIGKQDQYAAAFGGCNIFHFKPDDSVEVEPVLLDYKTRLNWEKNILLFFTGIHRLASSVLKEQKARTQENTDTLRAMAHSVYAFRDLLYKGNFEALGAMLHEGWLRKKRLSSTISNSTIDTLYNGGMAQGAWGGKVLGAGGGGCLLFMAPLLKHDAIRSALDTHARNLDLHKFREIPVQFVQSGVEVLVNANPPRPKFS